MKTLTVEDLKKMYPNCPESFLPRKPLEPFGKSKFKGDHLPASEWSLNDLFDKGVEYPVYDDGEVVFVVGKDEKGYKFVPSAWTKIKLL